MVIDTIKSILGVDVMCSTNRKVRNVMPPELTTAFGLSHDQVSNIAMEESQAKYKIGYLEKTMFMHSILRFNENDPLDKLERYHINNPGSLNEICTKYIKYIKGFDMMFAVDTDKNVAIMSEISLGIYDRSLAEYKLFVSTFLGKLHSIESEDFGTYGILYAILRVVCGVTNKPADAKIYNMVYEDRDPYNDIVKKTLDLSNDVFFKVFPEHDKSFNDISINIRYVKAMGVVNARIMNDEPSDDADENEGVLDYSRRDLSDIMNDELYVTKLIEIPNEHYTEYTICVDIDMDADEIANSLVHELSSLIQIYGSGNASKDVAYDETLRLLKQPCSVGGIRI